MLDHEMELSSALERTSTPRHYLMCRPTYFDVTYSINPWMDPSRPTSAEVGLTQWKTLHDTFVTLGHDIELIEPEPGLPDMVFAANGAIVLDGKVLVARFKHRQRVDEAPAYLEWFRQHGWTARAAECLNEGEGDFLWTGREFLAGSGFRSEPAANDEVREYFDAPVVPLTLVDPHYYHLDTALAILGPGRIMYHPAAFDSASQAVLRERFPDAILVDAADAAAFGLNAVSDGHTVVLPWQATGLAARLRDHGYRTVSVDVVEFRKAGGSVKCCTLELRR